MKRPGRVDALKVAAGALTVLLVALAALQYRWLREIAEAQRARMKADAAARAAAVAQDLDREVTRAYLLLQVDGESARTRDGSRYARQLGEFRRTSAWPGLVRETFVHERAADGTSALLRIDEAARRLRPAPWPAELEPVRRALDLDAARRQPVAVAPEVPALVAPVAEVFTEVVAPAGGGRPPAVRALVARRFEGGGPRRHTILVLDRGLILQRVLPDLLGRHGAGGAQGGAEYAAAVRDAGGRLLFGSAQGGGDAAAEILRLRFDDIDTAILRSFVPDVLRTAAEHNARMTIRVLEGLPRGPTAAPPGTWRLELRHRRGSVDQAVSATLARNLAVSAVILAVLGAGVVLLAASARRARAAARQQMEFVAAVSHELRTPLTAIRSAGENLADGVVRDPAQVARYGALVRDQGLRLSEMVEQTLGFAGADAVPRQPRPVGVAAMVERAIAAAVPPGSSFVVEREVAPGLPAALGEAGALERAVANLVSNARKHAAAGGRARVTMGAGPGSPPRTVVISVSDDGPGIPADEQPRLFAPFFRGRAAREEQVPGSGIGLAVVRRIAEAHGGTIGVESQPGRGTTFTLTLPAAAPDAHPLPDAQTHPAR